MSMIDPRFEYSLAFVLFHEGGYTHHPQDRGGETKFGISKQNYPHLDIASLTLPEAKKLYRRDFWDPYFFHRLEAFSLAAKSFDLSVNMGPHWAHRLLYRALRSVGTELPESGTLSNQAITCLNQAPLEALLGALGSEAAGYYRSLVVLRPDQNVFLKGWLNRAYHSSLTGKF